MTNISLIEKARENRTTALATLKNARKRNPSFAMFSSNRTVKPSEHLVGAFGKPAHIEGGRLAA